MTDQKYILKNKKIVPVDLMTWAMWMEGKERIMAHTEVNDKLISTIFLGLDHNFEDTGKPILFETMVFPKGSWTELEMERYSTYKEAELGHKKLVEKYSK